MNPRRLTWKNSASFISILGFFLFFSGYVMGDAPASYATPYHLEYTALKGFFVQDEPAKVGKDFDYVCINHSNQIGMD